jgi:transcriptional regulator with XRE-family HTH domain
MPPIQVSEERRIAIGRRIYVARKARRLKQVELANAVGISAIWMNYIEHGRRSAPSLGILYAIADALMVPLSQLVQED